MQARIVDSPIGQLQLVAESGYVTELNWPACHRAVALPSGNNDDVLSIAADELPVDGGRDLRAHRPQDGCIATPCT